MPTSVRLGSKRTTDTALERGKLKKEWIDSLRLENNFPFGFYNTTVEGIIISAGREKGSTTIKEIIRVLRTFCFGRVS
jgi:hypothetical protein